MREFMNIVENVISPAKSLASKYQGEHEGYYLDIEDTGPDTAWVGWFEQLRDHPHEKGAGAKLLQRLCIDADALGVELGLRVAPMDNGNEATALVRYYEHLGFVTVRREDNDFTMRRQAKVMPSSSGGSGHS